MLDILIVRYDRTPADSNAFAHTMLWAEAQDARVLTHDNTKRNIGLTAARIKLLERSKADVVLLMDFDFTRIRVNLRAMCELALEHGLCEPGDGRADVYEPQHHACNFMVLSRKALDDCGGLDPQFFVAYADWDMIRRLKACGYRGVCHGPSIVEHFGGSRANPCKQAIWAADRARYEQKWAVEFNGSKLAR